MNKKKILFLLGNIWSMEKNKGMPSVFKILEKSHEEYDISVLTTDKNNYEEELPNAKMYYFNNINLSSSNRFLTFSLVRINNLILNIKYLMKVISLNTKFDLIYCSSSIPVLATRILKFIYSIKTIHRIYGTFLYKNLGNTMDQIKKFEEVSIFKFKADKYIITNDGTLGDKVADYYNIDKSKVCFFRNGVETFVIKESKEELKKEFALEKDSFYFMCVCRLVSWKRVDRIINAMNKIKDARIKLIVIGSGDELEKLKELSKNANTSFKGSLSTYEVHQYMSVVDGFISMYDVSNVGNPLLEALSYNLPIVTYNSGNTKEIIDNKNGVLIKSIDENEIVDDLQKAMVKISLDEEYGKILSLNAKKYADNNLYDWDTRISMELNEMDKLINEN